MRPRTLLLTLVVIACILPAAYFTVLTVRIPARPAQIRYSTAPETTPSTSELNAMLATLARYVKPSDLAPLESNLKGVALVPHSKGNPIGGYLSALSELSGNITAITSTLNKTKMALATGDLVTATSDLKSLRSLESNSDSLLKTLYSSLHDIHSQYGVDTTQQLQAVTALDTQLQNDTAQINQLSSALRQQQGTATTVISISVSKSNILVGEAFSTFGYLHEPNGTALAGKNVTVLWDTKRVIQLKTNQSGGFTANISFSPGAAIGIQTITAAYVPEGQDALLLLPSSAAVQVNVSYRASSLRVSVSPQNTRPSDQVNVIGILSGADIGPLQNRTITFYLDQKYLGNATTDKGGRFLFGFLVPSVTNGTHTIRAIFSASVDIFAPAITTVPIQVTPLETRINFETKTVVLSGTKLTVYGSVLYVNSGFNSISPRSGNVTIYLDDRLYYNLTLSSNGTFVAFVQIPIGTSFGSHILRIQYVAADPSVASSSSEVKITVYNLPLMLALIAGVAAVVPVAREYRMRSRRKTQGAVSLQEVPVMERLAEPLSWELMLSDIHAERDPSGKIRKAFTVAQTLIRRKTGETEIESETPREFLHRTVATIPRAADTLGTIVELFELAEYSPYPIDDGQAKKAIESLTQLKAEIET